MPMREIRGVIRTAAQSGAVGSLPQKQSLEWAKFDAGTIELTLRDQDGELFDATDWTFVLTARTKADDGSGLALFAREGTADAHLVEFEIAEDDWEEFVERRIYRYDVIGTDPDGGRHQVVLESDLMVLPIVGQPGDAATVVVPSDQGNNQASGNFVRKASAGTISKGTPVYATGFSDGFVLAEAANASTLPAIGIAKTDITDDTLGFAVRNGVITEVDTSAWAQNATLYLDAAGGLTDVYAWGRQRIGVVLVSDDTDGAILAEIDQPQAAHPEHEALLRRLGGAGKWTWYFDNTFAGVRAEAVADGLIRRVLGGLQLDSSDSTDDGVTAFWSPDGDSLPIVAGGAESEWGFSALVKIGSVDEDASVFVGLAGGDSYVRFGALGDGVFALETENGSIASVVACDTAWHRVRAWRAAGVTTLEIDGVVCGANDDAYPDADCGFTAGAFNNSDEARTITINEIGALAPAVL